MRPNAPTSLVSLIETYIRAKDGNRPHLMRHVFAEQATLEMSVKEGSISFPPTTRGRAAIAAVLVSRFAQQFENVYTFCLGDPPAAELRDVGCRWLVVMTETETGRLRVGCGRYDWSWNPDVEPCVSRLVIAIDRMDTFAAAAAPAALEWAAGLPYPWCPTGHLALCPPPTDELEELVRQAVRSPG